MVLHWALWLNFLSKLTDPHCAVVVVVELLED